MKRASDWVSKKIRASKASKDVKRRATRHANRMYQRHGNLVMWFDVWEAYVYGAEGW